jgi:hypothetical protein
VDGDKTIPQATQRQEHLEMFLLLGDPALRLPVLPADVEMKSEADVAPGETIAVRGNVPERLAGARVRVTLERAVNSVPDDLELMPKDPGPLFTARDRVMLLNHDRANRFVLATCECVAKDGRFEASLAAPAKLPWPRLILRAYAATKRADGMSVRTLEVRKKP